LVYLSIWLFPSSYIILFWEFYFLPFSVQCSVNINSRLKSGNACYHTVQNVLPFRLLSKYIMIKIYRIVILYGCEASSPILSDKHTADGIQEWDSKEYYLRPRGTRWQGSGKEYITRSFMLSTPHQISFGWSNKK
jgi:hypothetical protein